VSVFVLFVSKYPRRRATATKKKEIKGSRGVMTETDKREREKKTKKERGVGAAGGRARVCI
jgi:hypothetical protein